MSVPMPPGLRIGSLRRTLISFEAPKPHPDRFCPLSSSSQSSSCSSRSLLSGFIRATLPSRRSLSSSSQVPRRPHTSRMSPTPRLRRVDPCVVSEIVALISGDSDDLESKLRLLNLSPSHALVSETLRVLNDRGVSALRFFGWVLGSYPDFRPNSEAYNLIVLNLGLFDDYSTMHRVFHEISSKGHCLTGKAFSFLAARGADVIKDSVRELVVLLSRVGGSCRGSGIFSLIKLLCSMNAFDLAISVMEETARRTSYYNVLIAAKCRNLDFQGARDVFDKMRRFGCDPNTKSYNYLLGSLFKNKRVVEACELLQAMEDLGYLPDSVTFEVILVHACKANRMSFAIKFVDQMLSEGSKPSLSTHAAFIKGYFWSGHAEDAYQYVVDMSMKDKCSVNMNFSLLAKLYCVSGRIEEAGIILYEMMGEGLKPNFPVYMRVMKDLHKISRGDLALELKTKFQQFSLRTDGR
ncbi:pentatricopeptide repeat-containing protein At5g16420, mitochondrial-like [Musa acuminata AAA Group]|uniref:pentatricopeptide repeat-containing protein At5g16420, mitochondrial-like n=1 Tax=Musa acuminata AAA Group TaxID=214697 RepID=UPI0031D346A3